MAGLKREEDQRCVLGERAWAGSDALFILGMINGNSDRVEGLLEME